MHHPTVSIITVVYNGVDTLEYTIKAVLALTYPHTEFIIIDGGSSDGTINIIKKYEKKISRWTSGPDAGLYDAMNKGMELATGDYFWFINSGDAPASSDILEKVFSGDVFADIYYGETVIIDAAGKEIGPRRLSPPKKLKWKDFRMGMLVSHQSFIASRRITKKYNLQYKFSADYDWCLHALKKAKKVRNTHLILSLFRDGGLTKQNIIPGLKERFQIMTKNYGLISTILAHFIIAPKFFWYLINNKRY
ncbi:glycosyltransferase family 2 protein [Thermophagus sp. OGC60D27]|uniref:glycosyltransferase family 2 protein n=1 Tax=Thermophagus sp. OGC60D27 TaxID=3458415 RepID=UPI0040381DCB